ncbi:tryptophan-specific transport protein [Candidatus Pantoea floridensis]|uniref:Aromatic amino acid permease n=2 Tax=Candidatus Pantoea floridensis TaxID=1938870 RepID=A0A286DM57_9GAMM|nr:tryptophan-specific transport protein [Enterobacteriaceae bacterium JKS000233]SOD59710.1 tryptophan-specific transport protein [Pantoea floridensis]
MMTEMTLSRRQPSVWWGAMIICGTVVGAGMFTLPVVMAGAWFGWAMIMLLVSWGGMLLSGLLFMRVSLSYPPGAGYDTLTKDLLGRGWATLNGLSILFVLGILTYAYISASGPVYQHSLNQAGVPISTAEAKVLLTIGVAAVVWLGTTGVSRLMTFCVLAKILFLILLFGGLLTQVNVPSLLQAPGAGERYWPYALGVLPFCLASFGYHGNITGLVSYYAGNKKHITQALVLGTLLSLALYVFWLTSTMGNLPRSAFPEIVQQGGDIAALMAALRAQLHVNALSLMMSIFSHFAVIASFLGVTAGLFDFIADRLGLGHSPTARFKTACLTFLPPLMASICWPSGFVAAIGFAGLFATLWAVIVPAMLAWRSQQRCSIAVVLLFAFGLLNILAWMLSWFKLLPEFVAE